GRVTGHGAPADRTREGSGDAAYGEDAAAEAGGIAGYGAPADRQRTEAVDPAALAKYAVVAESRVVYDRTVRHRQRPAVVEDAALVAVGDREPREAGGLARVHSDDRRGEREAGGALDDQAARPRALDGDAVVQVGQWALQVDRAGHGETDGELVRVAAGVGGEDGRAQGARARVGQGGDGQADLRGQPAVFEGLQPRPVAGPFARGRRTATTRSGALPLSQPGREPHDASPFERW